MPRTRFLMHDLSAVTPESPANEIDEQNRPADELADDVDPMLRDGPEVIGEVSAIPGRKPPTESWPQEPARPVGRRSGDQISHEIEEQVRQRPQADRPEPRTSQDAGDHGREPHQKQRVTEEPGPGQ